jgi:hypothetical protein
MKKSMPQKSAKPTTRKSSNSRGKKGGSTGTVPIAAAGAVAGAAVGAAAAVMLKDEKTRAKVGEVVNELTHKAAQYADTAVEVADDQTARLKNVKDEVVKTSKKSS